jgi:hypothetical protein
MSKPSSFFESLEPRRLLATYTVDNLGDVDDGNYDPGQTTLREAINQANSNPDGDSIQFDGALSGGTITLGGSHLYIADDLAITGLGQDFLTVSGNNSSRIFWVESGVAVGIFGLTIRNGAADSGAGIYNSGTLTLTGSTVRENMASVTAGGIFNNGTMTLTDSTVTGNNGWAYAGGIRNEGTLTIENSHIYSNQALSAAGIGNTSGGTLSITGSSVYSNQALNVSLVGATSYAGGIGNEGVLTLTNTQVYSNSSNSDAGGIENRGTGVVTLTDSSVTGNTAIISIGGISNLVGASMTLTNSTVSGNRAADAGGIRNGGALTITNSTISENLATFSSAAGGGIFNSGTLTLMNSTVSLNFADTSGSGTGTGGGIYNTEAGTVTITNSTISGNWAAFGGGIYHNRYDSGTVSLTVTNSTIAFNTGTGIDYALGGTMLLRSTILSDNTGGDVTGGGASVAPGSTHNLISTAWAAGGFADGVDGNVVGFSPNLGPLSSNGGATQTHAPAFGSPALGAGSNPLGLTTDQRGGLFARGDPVDIGAYQRQALTLEVSTNWDAADGDYSAGQLSLREAIAFANVNPLADTITFRDTLNNKVIKLRDGELELRGELTINGLGATLLSISGENATRVFFVDSGADVTIIGLTITGGNNMEGGGIYNAGSLSLRYSTVSGNTSNVNGGGLFNAGNMSVAYSTVSGNYARTYGGGIYNSSAGTLSVINSTVSSNSTTSSASGIAAGGSVTIGLSTIAFNSGYGMLLFTGSSTLMWSTIVSNNGFGDIASEGPTLDASSTHNLVGDAVNNGGLANGVSNNIVGVDPLLAPLAFNGGSTQTHAPAVGSPASNAGTDLLFLDYDQRGVGFSRLRGGAVDIGSFERGAAPTIGSLGVSAATVSRGGSVTLTANTVIDEDGDVATVEFWLDNGNGTLGAEDTLIGEDADGTGGYTLVYNVPSDAATGARTLFAVARDADGSESGVVQATTSVAGASGVPSGTADASDTQRVVRVNGDGHVIVFHEGWGYENLNQKTGAPAAIGDAVIWVDPKDGLTYVAAPSAFGLILFTRSAGGAWTSRNLSTQTGATNSPVDGLTRFTTVASRIVVVAGLTADGKIVAFQQTLGTAPGGGPAFKFVDISADLTARGQETPRFARGMISYVPSWDTWHLAGIDTSGNIQSVWFNPRKFTSWRTDNLSAITGAAALSGQLTVTLTSWKAINLTGLNTEGEVVTTWWIPRFRGNWANNNLTEEYDGSALASGNITGFVSPWGSMNYVGINSSGQVTVYWWTPVRKWVVSLLVPATTPTESVPSGALTSTATSGGTLNVYGNNADGDVLRISWPKPDGAGWNIENLTDIAVPM